MYGKMLLGQNSNRKLTYYFGGDNHLFKLTSDWHIDASLRPPFKPFALLCLLFAVGILCSDAGNCVCGGISSPNWKWAILLLGLKAVGLEFCSLEVGKAEWCPWPQDCQDMAALNLVMGIRDTSALQFLYTCKPLELAHRMLILFQQHIVSFHLWCAFQNRWFIAILNAHLWWFHYVFVLITGYWQSVKIKTLFCFFPAHYDQSNTTILAQPIVWVWGEVICLSGQWKTGAC